MEVWKQKPAVQVAGDTGWDDFFLDPDHASWCARFIIAMAGASKDLGRITSEPLEERQRAVVGHLHAIRLQSKPGSHNHDNAINALKILNGEIPATNQAPATPPTGDANPNSEKKVAPQPEKERSTRNPGLSQSTGGTALAPGQTAGTGNKPSTATDRAAKARAAKASKRSKASLPPVTTAPGGQAVPPAAPPTTGEPATA